MPSSLGLPPTVACRGTRSAIAGLRKSFSSRARNTVDRMFCRLATLGGSSDPCRLNEPAHHAVPLAIDDRCNSMKCLRTERYQQAGATDQRKPQSLTFIVIQKPIEC